MHPHHGHIGQSSTLYPPCYFAAIEGNCTPISQLWLFIVAPFVGTLCSSAVWKALKSDKTK